MKSINLTPRFWFAAVLVLITLFIGLVGPFIVRTDPDAVIGGLYDSPGGSLPMLLGTDNEGQSVMANLVYGTRTSLLVGLIAGLIASTIGLVLGLVAGYQGGWLDDVISGLTNVALAIPSIVLVILLGIALNNRSSLALALIIGITSWPWMARAVRAQSTQHPGPRAHRRRPAVGGLLGQHPDPRRPPLPAQLRRHGLRAAGLGRDPGGGGALPAGPRPVRHHQPRRDALLGAAVGVDPDRRLVGLPAPHGDADADRLLAAAAAVQPRRGLQPPAAPGQAGQAPDEGRPARAHRGGHRGPRPRSGPPASSTTPSPRPPEEPDDRPAAQRREPARGLPDPRRASGLRRRRRQRLHRRGRGAGRRRASPAPASRPSARSCR